MVTTIITAMAAYSNERVAAIILSVLYRMLTEEPTFVFLLLYDYINRTSIIQQYLTKTNLYVVHIQHLLRSPTIQGKNKSGQRLPFQHR